MGFFAKLFGLPVRCPSCGTSGAKEGFFSGVKCVSPGCIFYDEAYASGGFAHPLSIRYVNFKGEEKTFICDGDSLRVRGRHLSVVVAPRRPRIALKIDNILNRSDIRDLARLEKQKTPSPREKRVLTFHRRYGTTSPLYESLREKYPDF